ncbi:hypothetical protein [Sediminibacillus albus]|uniref:Uncharacterized protein n=1 Tax=Sediminibacillus albus TaxID=407036 RepID=A0A1G8VLR8_9BACI|nr:hypothetical protein [Sediminibacillus albus]SDJ66877.1 hypothetical protein SAMN05216243_0195 [Sediminibacillus albus]
MKKENKKDQAQQLRSAMDKEESKSFSLENQLEHHPDPEEEVNVLNLPPRKQVHHQKKTGMKWKISIPLIRFLLILFLLIIGLVLAVHFWGDELLRLEGEQLEGNQPPAGEEVEIKKRAIE